MSGYSPASIRDWKGCDERAAGGKKKEKLDQATRQLLPLTDEAIHQHLSGKNTLGIYPLLPDETCWFLAVDFDQELWKLDSISFVESCRELNVPAALDVLGPGKGAHVWIFFSAPVPATLARKLGRALLTKPCNGDTRWALLPMTACSRIRIRCPPEGSGTSSPFRCRKSHAERANSVFVDDALDPFPDQWRYLAGIPRMEPSVVERLVRSLERNGNVVGVRMSLADNDSVKIPGCFLHRDGGRKSL